MFRQFRRDEPWDSAHNLPLAQSGFSDLYRTPGDHLPLVHTYYQVFTGPNTPFEAGRQLTLMEMAEKDGAPSTLMIVEAGEAVPWTKPADIVYAADQPLPPLGGAFPGRTKWYHGPGSVAGMTVCFADCSTRFIRRSKFREELFRPLITWNDGVRVDASDMFD